MPNAQPPLSQSTELDQDEILEILVNEADRTGSDLYSLLKQVSGWLAAAGPEVHAQIAALR